MSRICVKNLPQYVAEDRLRDFFSQKGEVTDAKIMRTKDGKSRQFAFIGFRTITEADDAIKFFNNSYLDTCRITCEVARKVGDPDIPRPWSRYTAKKEDAFNDEDKTSVVAKGPVLSNDDGAGISTNIAKKFKQISENSDSQLQEFLQVMQPRIKTKLWANDTLGFPLLDQSDREKKESQSHKETKKQAARESRNRESGADQEDQSTVLQNGSVVEVSEKKALHELARDEVISDLDYFKSRVKKDWTDSESDNEDLQSEDLDDQEDDEMDGEEAPGVKIGENSHSENFEGENTDKENSSDLNDEKGEVLETGRLFVRNLPYTANEEDLVELFSKHGDVLEVHLVVDRDTKRSKGIAYVLYTLPESALRAMQELDNSIFQGRLLHVMPAKQPLEKKESNLGISGVSKTFKQQREEQKKASEASGDTRAWNSLFMRSDTIHTKRRNRLEQKRLNDLVFIRYNQILHHRYQLRDSIDPISLKDIDESNEWLTGRMDNLDLGDDEGGAADLVFDGEDLDWAVVSEAMGVDEPRARTRGASTSSTSTSAAARRRRATQLEEEIVYEDDDEEEEEYVGDDTDEENMDDYEATYDNDSP